MPSRCRSSIVSRSNSATPPSTVTRIGPAASLVENVGSRTVRAAPLASRSWARLSTSRVEQPKRSSLTTTSSEAEHRGVVQKLKDFWTAVCIMVSYQKGLDVQKAGVKSQTFSTELLDDD